MTTLKEIFTETFEWLGDLYDTGELNDTIQKAKGAINLTEERAKQWWYCAKLLAISCVSVSLILFLFAFLIGGYAQIGWLNAVAGLIIAPFLFVLLLWWTPLVAIIAVISEIIHLRFRSTPGVAVSWAKWWLELTCGVLLWQVIASLAFTFIPYWNAPSRIPVMMILALAMTLIGIKWGSGQKHRAIIRTLVILAFIAQVAVCFVPQLSTLATASTSRLGKNVQAKASKVEGEGFFSAPVAPPPRNLGWMRWEVTPDSQKMVRVYNGDEFVYKSPAAFKVSEAGGGYFHNRSATPEEVRSFKFCNLPTEGWEITIQPMNGSANFWLDFRIETRRTP